MSTGPHQTKFKNLHSRRRPFFVNSSGEIDIKIPVPSWAIAIVGASMVAISVTYGSLNLSVKEENVKTASETLSDAREELANKLTKYRRAFDHLMAADVLRGTFSTQGDSAPLISFRLETAAQYAENATFIMWTATDDAIDGTFYNTVGFCLGEEVASLKMKMNRGDVSAYKAFHHCFETWRYKARTVITATGEKINGLEKVLINKESERKSYQRDQIYFSLIGLLIVMLKDLPIWRNKVSMRGSS